jgi:transposase-like protein
VSAQVKSEILALVSESGLPRRRALTQLGLPKSTYYRWLKRQSEGRWFCHIELLGLCFF